MEIIKSNSLIILVLLLTGPNFTFSQPAYFQQEVNYNIRVSLDDKKNTLSGNEDITYINHSPDTLKELFFHLWPNAYKNTSTALCKQMMHDGNLSLYVATPEERGYISQLAFNINAQPVKWQFDSIHIDICKLTLQTPLAPGDTVLVSTPFFVKIPDAKFSRLGHVGQSFMITQWYPKPAVYDMQGWHPLPYLNQGEFYSEFGAYDVSITLPENYVVAATGNLQTESEKQFIQKNISETKQTVSWPMENNFPPSSEKMKTVQYKLDNVHDFAWFADKRFHITQKNISLAGSGKNVQCYAYFTNDNPELWKMAAENVADAVYQYSEWIGDYPFETCTAIDGTISAGSGMEYPTITNIGKTANSVVLANTIAHEVGHNWFYGILGSNERTDAWMDEGINSYYEARFMNRRYATANFMASYLNVKPKITSLFGFDHFSITDFNSLSYLISARTKQDQPLVLTSEKFTSLNYGVDVYSKTALALQHLENYLGNEVFDSAMQTYYALWKFKHPHPEDFEKVITEVSHQKLDWFFEGMIGTTKKINYRISSLHTDGDNLHIKVKNRGLIAAPFSIATLKNDSVLSLTWHEGFKGSEKIIIPKMDADHVVVNHGNNFLDISESDNIIRTNGIFKKIKPLQFAFLSRYENPNRTQLFYLPAIGYNTYNGMMGGIVIHNISFLKKKFEFALTPLYGFHSRTAAGTVYMNYSLPIPGAIIDDLEISATPKYFAYGKTNDKNFLNYLSIPVGIDARLKKSNENPAIEYHVALKSISNYTEVAANQDNGIKTANRNFTQFQLIRQNQDKLDPGNFTFTAEQGDRYLKGFMDAEKEFTTGKIKKAIFIRFFAGTFFKNKRRDGLANFQTSAWRGGKDYLMQEMYAERDIYETTTLSRQIVVHDGGLKAYFPVNTRYWLLGLNFSVKLPIPMIRLYTDATLYKQQLRTEEKSIALQYDGGICLSLVKDAMEVYFPLIYSKDIQSFFDNSHYDYANKITFVFDIKKWNPAKLRDSISR